MTHHGKIARDDDKRWAGVCDCGNVWTSVKWADCFNAVFHHVRSRRKSQSIGIGFCKRDHG